MEKVRVDDCLQVKETFLILNKFSVTVINSQMFIKISIFLDE